MTQTFRRKLIKMVIALFTIGAGVWAALQPTGLINAIDVHAVDYTDVCSVFGNCPKALDTSNCAKNSTAGNSDNAACGNTVVGIVGLVANGIIGIAVIVSVFFIIYAGWTILSGGSNGIKEGQQMLINAFIGLAVSILSFIIVQYLVGFIDSLFRR